jgi:hypothetical protein
MELTAWSSPWGISDASNLTPAQDTELGISRRRRCSSRRFGPGVTWAPPGRSCRRSWQVYGRLPYDDLKAIYAYLRSIPPIKNRVPEPLIAEES